MAKTGADGERYDPRGWHTRENNLIIKSAPPRPTSYHYNSGLTLRAAVLDLARLIDEVPEAWGIFERLSGG